MNSLPERLPLIKEIFPEFYATVKDKSPEDLEAYAIELYKLPERAEPEQWFVEMFHPEFVKGLMAFDGAADELEKDKEVLTFLDKAKEQRKSFIPNRLGRGTL